MATLPKTFADAAQVTANIDMIDRVMSTGYPNSYASATWRTKTLRQAIEAGVSDLDQLHGIAIEAGGYAFIGSGAGMRRLDALWTKLLERFPMTIEDAELAAHITNDLAGAR